MTEAMIVDMTEKDGETDRQTEIFQKKIKAGFNSWQKQNPSQADDQAPWYKIVRNAVYSSFGCEYFVCAILVFIAEGLAVAYTYFLVYLIRYLSDDKQDWKDGLKLVAIYTSAIFVSALFRNYYIFLGYTMAVKMRKVFVSAMYDKIGDLSIKSLTETNSGKLITLISSDIFIVERAITMTPFILASPLIVCLCLFFVYLSSEWFYVISTLIVWLLCIGSQYICSLQTKTLKEQESILNDQRMKLVNDMVVGIRTIKSYAWENHYLSKIVEIRNQQTNIILRYNMVGSLSYSLFQNFGLVAVVVIFVTKWMREETISQAECFSLLAMVYFLFFSVTSMTLYAMTTIQQVMVLMQRLSDIFRMEEFKKERIEDVPKNKVCVKMKDAAFSWGFRVKQDQVKTDKSKIKLQLEEVTAATISKLNLNLKSNSLLMVAGEIGSGKTTLLNSIMNETIKKEGILEVKGKIAYVEQEPFIISGNIEENITFGLEFNEEWFDHAISASALTRDMPNFANGRKTMIGERGVNISGGQKARISLARAIYQNADIYLLDDPLSAVDPEVANLIFEDAILGALKDKCVVLVTHQLQFMQRCPQVLILKNGVQYLLGTNEELLNQGFNSLEILQNYNKKKEQTKVQTLEEVLAEKLKEDLHRAGSIQLLRQATNSYKKSMLTTRKTNIDLEPKKESQGPSLIVPEDSSGKVTFQDYKNFILAGLGPWAAVLFVFFCVAAAILQLGPSFYLANWTKQDYTEQQKPFYPMMFGLSILVFIIFTIGRSFVIFWICLSSSNSMHKQMTEKVLRAKILFFDSNPIGRIITRFSKDIAVFDMVIPVLAVFVIQGFLRTITVSITVIVVNPYLIIVVAVCAVLMVFTLKQGKPAMVDGQRLDGQIRAPIHTTFAMIVAGLVTLRAYDKMRYFKQDFNNNLEKCANVTFCYIGANRWLGVRLDMICVLFTITTTLVCVLQKDTQDSALLTLSLQIITDVIAMFSISLRMYAEFENYMTSSQRIFAYTKLESEDLLVKDQDTQLKDKSWPNSGKIEFTGATMKYRDELEPSIKGLNFKVYPGMRVGIVGRTGAGKSSILQALFRLIELCEGKCEIDGVDTKNVGLHQLRHNIAFIPQSPFLLQGTIRENLDPFEDVKLEEIVQIVKDVGLDKKINSLSQGLQTYCSENNNLFSVGQKQLVCLIRAIVRKTKILVLDEATANVDLETDNLIQQKLREKFTDCTVLIIAHRLATIIDVDRICVMADGRAGEFDHPYRLLVEKLGDQTITNQSGLFAQMCLATGEDTAQSLFEIAKKQYYSSGQKFPYDFKESLTVKDNRTGRHYEIPISKDSFDSKYLLEIKSQQGTSIVMRDPTLSSTVIYQSSMVRFDTECQVYRVDFGSILAGHDLVDATYLLLSGNLPNEQQKNTFLASLNSSGQNCDTLRRQSDLFGDLKAQQQGRSAKTLHSDIPTAISLLTQLLLGQSLQKHQKHRKIENQLVISLLDFRVNDSVFGCRRAAQMGKSVFDALCMANALYDFEKQMHQVSQVTTYLAGGRSEGLFTHQFDPRLPAIKQFASMVAASTGSIASLNQIEDDLASQREKDNELKFDSPLIYQMFVVKQIGISLQVFEKLDLLAKAISWIAFYKENAMISEQQNLPHDDLLLTNGPEVGLNPELEQSDDIELSELSV